MVVVERSLALEVDIDAILLTARIAGVLGQCAVCMHACPRCGKFNVIGCACIFFRMQFVCVAKVNIVVDTAQAIPEPSCKLSGSVQHCLLGLPWHP